METAVERDTVRPAEASYWARLFARRRFRALLWWWAIFLGIVPFALARNYSDDAGMPQHGAWLEEHLFGSLPTVWLQDHVYELWPGGTPWISVFIHGSWFVVPWVAALLVSFLMTERVGSFFRWWLSLHALVLVFFVLFPMQPPWMADGHVIRINELVVGDIQETNPVSAMPSLHIAFPMVIAFWFFRERWTAAGWLMTAYTLLTGLEVVFSGEHYVIDVVGGVLVAAAVAVLARVDYSRVLRALVAAPRRRAGAREAVRSRIPAVGLPRSERAQALIEFAFVAPIMFVLLFAVVDFAIAIDRRVVLQHAVREGARFGAVHTDENDIEARTVAQAQDIVDDTPESEVVVCYIDEDGNTDPGDAGDSVKVKANFSWDFPIASEIMSVFGVSLTSIDITPAATARLERTVPGAASC